MPDQSPKSLFTYLDFDLEIGLGRFPEYPVIVHHSPKGEAQSTMRLPFDERGLEQRLNALQMALLRSAVPHRQALSDGERLAQSFGGELFEALLSKAVCDLYLESLEIAQRQGKGLRLRLNIQPPELAALPWEFLYDASQAEFISLMRECPMVRYIEQAQPVTALESKPPLKILGMVSSPDDLPMLDIEHEKQRMESALAGLIAQGLVQLTWLEGRTWRDLQRAMRGGPWHVFHFIGHGGFDKQADEGILAFADEQGHSQPLRASDLARLLGDHSSLRLVFLNACEGGRGSQHDIFSSSASILVRRGLPAVLAMQYAISDRASIEFSRSFYEALADGLPVDAAVSEGRKATSLASPDTLEWVTPVLYLHAQDGTLFRMPSTPRLERRTGSRPAPNDREIAKILDPLYAQGLNAMWDLNWVHAIECFQQVVDFHPGYLNAANKLEEARRQLALAQEYDTIPLEKTPPGQPVQVAIRPNPQKQPKRQPGKLMRWLPWLAAALALILVGAALALIVPRLLQKEQALLETPFIWATLTEATSVPATPLPPTPEPATAESTGLPTETLNPAIYDSFADERFDNTFNSELWIKNGGEQDPLFQQNGKLHMVRSNAATANSTSLWATQYNYYTVDKPLDFWVAMRLNEQTTNGSAEMHVWFAESSQGITCNLISLGSHEALECMVYSGSNSLYSVTAESSNNQWHIFKIGMDPIQRSITFKIDDTYYDSYYLTDANFFAPKTTLAILVYNAGGPENIVHGEFDWVKVETK